MRLGISGLCAVALACGDRAPAPAPTAVPDALADARLLDAPEVAPVQIPDTTPARRLWVDKLDDAATFDAYSKEIGGERFTKLVIDLRSNAIYYFDVNVYPVHKDFIFGELYKKPKTRQAVRVFDRNYGAVKVDFMMCYLVHHLNQDVWTLAFWDGDKATAAHVTRAYQRVKETFFLGDRLRYRPDSNYQEGVARKLAGVPVVLNDELYKLADYTAFNKGVAIGPLRIVKPGQEEGPFAPEDIVVLATSLPDITPVAGIIAETFSSPLSHVSLRAKGWRIPNVGLREASTKLAALAGKPVYFEAKDAEYVLRAATDAELVAETARRQKKPVVTIPKPDLVSTELEPLATMTADDVHRYGAKASNLGVIIAAKLPGIAVPPGFGVPFAYYDAHVRAAGIDKQLAALFTDAAVAKDASLRKGRLEAIRNAIIAAPLAPELCEKIGTALETLPAAKGVFVRSSHNAEDLDDFSGAGLHDTFANMMGRDAVCAALKKVWASAWKLTAYDARAHAGIDQATVAAGALIQTGVAATAAGVLVTVHPTDPTDERNYTINAKSGLGMAVVDGRKVPESLLVSWYNHGIRVLSRSDEETKLVFDENGGVREIPNPNRGKPVLSNKMAIDLADTAKRLTKVFGNPKLDVEWVYAGTELYIVQTRPLVGQ